MNQPKFNIGQTVKTGMQVFTVLQMKLEKGSFFYRERDSYHWISEEILELYLPPQKKKLYAYMRTTDGEICFGSREASSFYGHGFERAPEYDLEYPEDK